MSLFPQKIVGIDFHDYSAELVELKKKGDKISLEAYNRAIVPADVIKNGEIAKPDALKRILIDLLKNSNPKPVETTSAAIIFPPSKVLTHIFTFPVTLSEKEIRKAIPYQAETVIPFSIKDVYWDFSILERERETKKLASQHVLFAAITKDVADKYADVLESIGLTPFLFGVHARTLKNATFQQIPRQGTSLVIDVGVLAVNYLIVENGVTKYYFSDNEGGQTLIKNIAADLQEPENEIFQKKEKNKLQDIAKPEMIKEFIEKNYRRGNEIIEDQISNKVIKAVDDVILTGEFLNLPNFYKLANEHFKNQRVTIGDPKTGIKIDDKKFMPAETRNHVSIPYSIYFTNVIGVSMCGLYGCAERGINLLPQRLKESFANKRNALLVAIASIFMTVLTLFAAAFFFFMYNEISYERLALEAKKSSIEKLLYGTRYQQIRDEINKFNNELDQLETIDAKLYSVPLIIEEIEALLPTGIQISSIDYDDEQLLFGITGIAKDREALLETQKNFEEAIFIKEVIAPISNYDEKQQLSFLIQIVLDFSQLPPYGSNTNTK